MQVSRVVRSRVAQRLGGHPSQPAAKGSAKLTSPPIPKSADRSTSLLHLLKALILSYTSLVSALLIPPPSLADPASRLPDGSEAPTEAAQLADHIRLIAINMHFLINELRPVQVRRACGAGRRRRALAAVAGSVPGKERGGSGLTVRCPCLQARETLKGMMRSQIDERRAKTAAIKQYMQPPSRPANATAPNAPPCRTADRPPLCLFPGSAPSSVRHSRATKCSWRRRWLGYRLNRRS